MSSYHFRLLGPSFEQVSCPWTLALLLSVRESLRISRVRSFRNILKSFPWCFSSTHNYYTAIPIIQLGSRTFAYTAYPPRVPRTLKFLQENTTNLWLGLAHYSRPITCTTTSAASTTIKTPKCTTCSEVPSNTWSRAK